MEDIKEEVDFWKFAVVCVVVGANPPTLVMEGFIRRIRGRMGEDLVAPIGKGGFVVRFIDMGGRDKAIQSHYTFDKKRLIVKPWNIDDNMLDERIQTVPIWIQLPKLNVKYWGKNCLFKLVETIGKPVKLD